jgi:hypothetical protein
MPAAARAGRACRATQTGRCCRTRKRHVHCALLTTTASTGALHPPLPIRTNTMSHNDTKEMLHCIGLATAVYYTLLIVYTCGLSFEV